MRKRLRKKNRIKVERHIAYCKHFGLPIVLDESSRWKKKHSYRLRAMMEKRKKDGLSLFCSAPCADQNASNKPSSDPELTVAAWQAAHKALLAQSPPNGGG